MNKGEVRPNGQSQTASGISTHQLPDNKTDCGWAPFGESPASAHLRSRWPCRALHSQEGREAASVAQLSRPCQFGSSAGIPEWDCISGSSSVPSGSQSATAAVSWGLCAVVPPPERRPSQRGDALKTACSGMCQSQGAQSRNHGWEGETTGPCGAGLSGALQEVKKPMPTLSHVGSFAPVTCT